MNVMNGDAARIESRVALLERSLRRTRFAASVAIGSLAIATGASFALRSPATFEEVRTRRLAVVDEAGRVRVAITEDAPDAGRRAHSAGLTVFDETGHERGGFGTFADGSVVFAMDAPHGVGDPMPDRIGLFVGADGSAHVMLLDNMTRAVAKLHSDGSGGGGVQVFDWDMDAEQIHVRTMTFEGDDRETIAMGPKS